MRFQDKCVIVTGAGSGIGRECALHFAREGAWVAAADLDADTAQRTAEAIAEAADELFDPGPARAAQLADMEEGLEKLRAGAAAPSARAAEVILRIAEERIQGRTRKEAM